MPVHDSRVFTTGLPIQDWVEIDLLVPFPGDKRCIGIFCDKSGTLDLVNSVGDVTNFEMRLGETLQLSFKHNQVVAVGASAKFIAFF